MLIPKPRQSTQIKTKPIKRPSEIFQMAFQSEEKAQQLSDWVERHPLFQTLLAEGIIRKVLLQGFIPPERYITYMERYVSAFIRRYRLHEHPEWQKFLTHPDAEKFISQWAQKWGVSEQELRRVLRFLRSHPKERREQLLTDVIGETELVASTDFGDLSDIIEIASEFVHRYRLSQQDFVKYVMSGRFSARQIADRFGCSPAEAQALLNALDRLEILEMIGAMEQSSEVIRPVPTATETLLAEAWVDEQGKLHLHFLNDCHTPRYLIDRSRLEAWRERHGEDQELNKLLEAIYALNERSGVLATITYTVCLAQRAFLASGNLLDLRPLSQADIARQTGYNRSVICRLVRGQVIKTPYGRFTLMELMPSRKEVISRLINANPDWTDGQISDELRRRFGINLSRRAVNYHRHHIRLSN